MKPRKEKLSTVFIIIAITILAIAEFILHREVIFMMDDNWYSTNLATGNPLHSISDVVESQRWHFLNWGGRIITHGLLQLTLMMGELFCDFLNLIMTFLLTHIMCIIANRRTLFSFFTGFTLIIALNANMKMSMFWQSGAANYIYSSVWILFFLWVYLRHIQAPDQTDLTLVNLWLPFLGLITGWSNENMGPASFVLTIIVILYTHIVQKGKVPLWMITGSFFCLLGSAFVILAPGNFVRVSCLPEESFFQTLYNRILSMLCAGTEYLFGSALFLVVLVLVYTVYFKEKLQPFHWMLLIHAILSYGAMVLSPHYPDRATFGTMVVCIILIISILSDIFEKKQPMRKFVYVFMSFIWIYSLYAILREIYLFFPA